MKQLLIILLAISLLPVTFAEKTIVDWQVDVDGHVFKFIPGIFTYDQARRKASNMKGRLACLKDEKTTRIIYEKMLDGADGMILIGGYKWGEKWQWVDGTDVEWSNWPEDKVKKNGIHVKYLFFQPKVYGDKWAIELKDKSDKIDNYRFYGFILEITPKQRKTGSRPVLTELGKSILPGNQPKPAPVPQPAIKPADSMPADKPEDSAAKLMTADLPANADSGTGTEKSNSPSVRKPVRRTVAEIKSIRNTEGRAIEQAIKNYLTYREQIYLAKAGEKLSDQDYNITVNMLIGGRPNWKSLLDNVVYRYLTDDERHFFVKYCNNEQMNNLYRITGGTLQNWKKDLTVYREPGKTLAFRKEESIEQMMRYFRYDYMENDDGQKVIVLDKIQKMLAPAVEKLKIKPDINDNRKFSVFTVNPL